jgi:hypothetical protein
MEAKTGFSFGGDGEKLNTAWNYIIEVYHYLYSGMAAFPRVRFEIEYVLL